MSAREANPYENMLITRRKSAQKAIRFVIANSLYNSTPSLYTYDILLKDASYSQHSLRGNDALQGR